MPIDEALRTILEPLLALAEPGSPETPGTALRLVARPGDVMVDRPEGSATAAQAAAAWDAERHRLALEKLPSTPVRLTSGATVAAVADAIVLRVPPDPARRTDQLAREGLISPLAGRTLSAAVGLGRNVLVAGPWAACVPLIAGLVADGRRPAVLGGSGDAVPASWVLLADVDAADAYGADRIACWSLPLPQLVALMRRRSGVVGWVDARRLERALVRFETAFDGSGPTPLQVLAALDLVVVVTDAPTLRVTEVAEITLVDEGYRPRLLFTSGLPPIPTALVPVDAPVFLTDLAQAGFGVLADELRHAVAGRRPPPAESPARVGAPDVVETGGGASRPSAGSAAFVPPDFRAAVLAGSSPSGAAPRPHAGRSAASGYADGEYERARASGPPPTSEGCQNWMPPDPEAPPPGWELDRLGDEGLGEQPANGGANASSEDANLAATFGLGPPPRPPGVRPDEPRSFDEALRRARERAEEAGEDEPT